MRINPGRREQFHAELLQEVAMGHWAKPCGRSHRVTGVPCVLPEGHTGDHKQPID